MVDEDNLLKKNLPFLALILLSCLAWFLGLAHYFTFEHLAKYQQFLNTIIQKHPIISIELYGIAYIIVVALSLPVASFMTIASGLLFGQWIGTVATVIFATLGASVLFLSAKMASKELLEKKSGSFAKKMQRGFKENAFFYLMTLRLIPLFPFFAVNIASALFQIPFRTFFWGTLIGIIPGSFIYVAMGVALREVIHQQTITVNTLLSPTLLLALVGLGILSLLPVLYKYFKKKTS